MLNTAVCIAQVITERLIILTDFGMDISISGKYMTLAVLTHNPFGLTLTLRSWRHSLHLCTKTF